MSIASYLRSPVVALLAVATLSTACSKDDGDSSPASAAAATTDGPQGKGKAGSESVGGGQRRASSIILAASDVKTVELGTIEAGIPISGDLKAIEESVVRARLEGDLVGVFVREGEHVRQGQLLARFEDSEQESNRVSALADLAAAQSDLETSKWNADQSEQLFKAGAISERDNRTSQQTLAASRAKLAAAEARVRATTSLVTDTKALAPTTGVVAKRSVENGEHVARGAEMFTVVRSDVLELAAAVPARQANEIRVGQTVHFASGGRDLEGRVARVSPTIDPTNRSITVYTQVSNAAGNLKGNSFATGRIVSRTVNGAMIVPTGALKQSQGNDKPFVFRLGAEDNLERAPVSVGIVDESQAIAEIVDGLKVGDRIVVGNVGTLGAGMKVTIAGEGEGARTGSREPGTGTRSPSGRPAP